MREVKGRLKFAGNIPVDSGSVMIVDPCYVSNENGKPFFEIKVDDLIEVTCKSSTAYQELYHKALGRHLDSGVKGVFNPDVIDTSSLNNINDFGQLGDLAVVSTTYCGDGLYPVFVEVDDENKPLRIIIDFVQNDFEPDEEEEDEDA